MTTGIPVMIVPETDNARPHILASYPVIRFINLSSAKLSLRMLPSLLRSRDQ